MHVEGTIVGMISMAKPTLINVGGPGEVAYEIRHLSRLQHYDTIMLGFSAECPISIRAMRRNLVILYQSFTNYSAPQNQAPLLICESLTVSGNSRKQSNFNARTMLAPSDIDVDVFCQNVRHRTKQSCYQERIIIERQAC